MGLMATQRAQWMSRIGILLALAFGSIASAQTPPKRAQAPPQQNQAIGQSFDMDRISLPPHFVGSNADAIYDAATGGLKNPVQSEFESRSEYQARLADLSTKPFWGGLNANDHFAFVLGQAWSGATPVSASGEDQGLLYGFIETKYDAEAQQLTVKIPIDALSDADGNFYRWASLWRRVQTHLGSYIGQNSFGVKKTVNRLGVKDTELVIQDADWLDFDCQHESDSESCSIPMDPIKARVLSRNVRVIVVGSIVAPFVSAQNDVSQPSIDNPWELHSSYRLLHIRLDQLILADSQTGQIVKEYSRKNHSAEYPLNVEFKLAKNVSFSDARCTKDSDLFPSSLIDVDYSVDGGDEKHEILKAPLLVSARQFVDLKITYCNVSRVEVRVNGKPYDLQCEGQEQYIANRSKCNRIQIAP